MNIRRANSGIRMASHRLVLREFVVTDEDAVHAFAADPLVTRFTDWGPNSVEDTRAFLGRGLRTGDQPTASRVQAVLARRQPTTELVIREIWLLRLRAVLAEAHGDETAYRDYRIAAAQWRRRLATRTYKVGRGDAMTAVEPES